MNRRPTKAEIRREHEKQIQEFLSHGGKIQRYDMGATGLVDGKYNTHHMVIEKTPIQTRTPVNDVVAAIDSRRKARVTRTPAKPKSPIRKKKVIYDDFGEPLRTVWIDE